MSSLSKKLQIKPGKKWVLFNAPENYLNDLEPLPDGVTLDHELSKGFDGLQLFIKNSGELAEALKMIASTLQPDTIFWITYPKKSSGIKTDLEMMGSWDEPAKYGLRIVTSVSVNDTWTALRFKPEELTKVSDSRNDNISQNDYGAYINVENKTITLPEELKAVLQNNQQALAFYESLSYSNRKEYVLWILTAKQEKTRHERLTKMVEKLTDKKKNPSEK